MKDMQKARDKGAYSDADYNAMSEPTNMDFPLSKEFFLCLNELQSCFFKQGMLF